MSPTQFPIITICGSMRYYQWMLNVAGELTAQGFIVLMPFVTTYLGGQPMDAKKAMLDDMHFTKISMSEAIYVVGPHRGQSTTKEIEYARTHNIKVVEIA